MSGYYKTVSYTYNVKKSREDFIGFDDIKVCRPKLIYFKVTGLRPNTRHFAFFDNTNVTNYINTSIATINDFKSLGRNDIRRNPGEKYINETGFPTELGGPTGAIYSDAEGKIEGVFYLQSNSSVNFPAGTRSLSFVDISKLDPKTALSFARGIYSANGGIENYETVYYTVQKTGTRQEWVNTPDPTIGSPQFNGGGGDNPSAGTRLVYQGPAGYRTDSYGNTYSYGAKYGPVQPEDRGFGRDTSSNSNDNSNDTVICTSLHSLGLLPDDIYKLDAEFGKIMNETDPMVGDGYRLWATPVAEYIKGKSIGSKIALACVKPIAQAWAQEMAHIMEPENYKTNFLGKMIMIVGHPTCRAIGNLFLEKRKNANDISS